jgi:hypothetical protein
MGPKKGPVDDPEQPAWAKRMEEAILSRLDGQAGKTEVLRKRVSDLEHHSRKWNLLIFGVEVSAANCEERINKLLKEDLGLQEVPLLAACHPIPHPRNEASIIRFVRLKDKEAVQRALPKLRGKKISVVSDLSLEGRELRKQKGAEARILRGEGKIVRLRERGGDVFLEEKVGEGRWKKRAE